jgi:methylenetetrahydrofolate dehydrogenase (NADP+)/methenyltetrahydrofolate cyclohydrolase
MAQIIDGVKIAEEVKQQVRLDVEKLKEKGVVPGLAAILVGNDPASAVYVRNKARACEATGIFSQLHHLSSHVDENEVLDLIHTLNQDARIHGILVQLPLPEHINDDKILDAILPQKDVDGLTPVNQGMLQLGRASLVPCTPLGVIELLSRSGVIIEGEHVVVVGRSRLVGMPLAILLAQKSATGNATVTICHSKSKNLAEITRQADILIVAMGKPQFIGAAMVKNNAIVIDVGINRLEDPSSARSYRLVGDVDFDSVKNVVQMITPVPGGVGPMTIAMLLHNTVHAARNLSRQ